MIRLLLSRIAALLLITVSNGCGPLPDPRAILSGDLEAPIYLGTRAISASMVEIDFHETVETRASDYSCRPELPLATVSTTENTVQIAFSEPMLPGSEYALYGRVHDASGNSMKFITKLFGFNPDIPDLLLNEFTTRGSGKHPDCVELIANTGGNLAGVALYEGTSANWADRFIFPSLEVSAGDFIVVHFKPEGALEEIDEITDTSESGGYDAADGAWDFWIREGNGLSGNNGVITLYASPGGEILDAVVYSNRTSASDDDYSGFGSRKLLEQAEAIAQEGAWATTDGTIRPEDAVNPEGSTGTRSICRKAGIDTNSAADWYIVPTRGVTFGEENTVEIYTP